jgi:plastocyanin
MRLHLFVTILALAGSSVYADDPGVTIAIRDDGFAPSEVKAARGTHLRVEVVNETDHKVEFESFQLNREHVIKSRSRATFYLSGLAPGRYEFFDDLHRDHRGVLLVE